MTFSLPSHRGFATLVLYAVYGTSQMFQGNLAEANSMDQKNVRYHAYLLRLWQVKDQGQWVWRVSLDNAHTHERLGFGSLDELFGYLRQQTETLGNGLDSAEKEDDRE